MNIEMNQFRDVFFEESAEHVASMESALLGLESSPEAGELLKQIFRSAHTIKGGSGMFGLSELGRFTHSMENLLDKMRNGAIQPSPPLVDLLLRSCDVVKALLVAAKSGDEPPAELAEVIEAIDRAREAGAVPPANGQATAVHGQAPEPPGMDGQRLLHIRFTPAPDSLRRGLEPLLVLRELSSLGTLHRLEVDTKALPSLEEMDPSTCYLGWSLTLETGASDESIEDVFGFVEKGSEYTVAVAGAPAAPAQTAAPAPPLHAGPASPPAVPAAARPPLPPPEAEAPPPRTPTGGAAEAARRSATIGESTIRVDVDLLDRIMNTVGELVLARNQILQFSINVENASLQAASQRLNLITTELQEGVMKTRMQPIGVVWGIMPRLVRDLSHDVNKQIKLEMEGAETELDRTLLEAIKDPLTHIVRNSCDHGIEAPAVREQRGKPAEGRLLLRAYHEGGHVIIEMTDDGAGIDPARIRQKVIERGLLPQEQAARMSDRDVQQMIFQPGFSTAEKVTGISGRGVGMDVVKTNIDRIGGAIDISSQPGKGTTVKLKIPLTLAIIPGLVVNCGGERFVIPQVSLLELVRLEGEACRTRIEYVHESPVYRRRGSLLPLVYLNGVLKLKPPADDSLVNIVVLQAEEKAFGLVVDDIHDTQEIVVKPLGKQLKALDCYSGATIMGDGRVSLILDVLGIAQQAGIFSEGRAGRGSEEEETVSAGAERQTVLLFRAAGLEQVAVPLSLVARLEEFPLSRVEGSARRRVIQYRDRILPLVSLSEILDDPAAAEECAQDPLPVIVFSDGDAGVGLIVRDILDVVEEEIRVRDRTNRPAVLGSAIVAGRVTDFLDLRPVLAAAGVGLSSAKESGKGVRIGVLLADKSPFQRAMLRNELEMAGYRVLEAASSEEAAAKLSAGIDVLAADVELVEPPQTGRRRGGEARFPLRQHAAEHGIGVLTLLSQTVAGGVPGYEDCELECKFNREAMLGSIARLAQAVNRNRGGATAPPAQLPGAGVPVGRV